MNGDLSFELTIVYLPFFMLVRSMVFDFPSDIFLPVISYLYQGLVPVIVEKSNTEVIDAPFGQLNFEIYSNPANDQVILNTRGVETL